MSTKPETARSSSLGVTVAGVLFATALLAGCGDDDDGPTVAFTEPTDGATVHGVVPLAMISDGIAIEAAGEVRDGTGHFHVIADAGCVDTGEAIGKDADHLHFGNGQSEGVIYLGPGSHQLCLQVGDGVHSALDVTDSISLTVDIADRDEWCAVASEVDELVAVADDLDDFAASQASFENLARLIAQLSDGIDHVDDEPEYEIGGVTASPREHVDASLTFMTSVSEAITTASDWDAAFAEIDALYAADRYGSESELPGGRWIETTCGIDLED